MRIRRATRPVRVACPTKARTRGIPINDSTAALAAPHSPRAVFFVSDSTGITAETLGGALLANFPGIPFEEHTIRFVDTIEEVRMVVANIEREDAAGKQPIVFTTVKDAYMRSLLAIAPGTFIDLLGGHLTDLEEALGVSASELLGQYHNVNNTDRYFQRMRAIEYAIEHDDGQSRRALDKADVIIIAPSRCGKTPTTMYLAMQYGLLVANYPLTDDDYPTEGLPPMVAPYTDRCFGLTTTALRLSQVRHERRPNSTYSSLAQCTRELRQAEELYRRNGVPFVNSAAKSVEEMSAVIMQSMHLRA